MEDKVIEIGILNTPFIFKKRLITSEFDCDTVLIYENAIVDTYFAYFDISGANVNI